jgi:hypothetical protein
VVEGQVKPTNACVPRAWFGPGGPDLDQYGILGGSVKGLNFQVLLDPLEKKFDLPAAGGRVQPPPGRTGPGGWLKSIFLDGLRVPVMHPAQ